MKTWATSASVALLVLIAGRADAAQTISSPLLVWSGQLGCYVRNVGVTPVSVTVQLLGADGTAIAPTFEDCSAGPLAGGFTCAVLAAGPPSTFLAACSATAAGSAKSLRGTLEVRYGPSGNVRMAEELW